MFPPNKKPSMMFSTNPSSLFLAILLCFPLAVVFLTTAGDVQSPTNLQSNTISDEKSNHPGDKITAPTKPISQFPVKTPRISHTIPPPSPELRPDDVEEDSELLRRAAHANPHHSPANAPKKIAFMFLTTTPLPFAPLWEQFFNETNRRHYNIYIHADPTRDYNPPFSGVFSGRVIPSSRPTRRNSPTLASAARHLLSHALLDDPANYMFALLSASCVPLHSFSFTYNHLASSSKSFIEILSNETGAHGRWTARGEHVMLPEVTLDEFRIGSQFWILTRRHVLKVARDERLWRKFRLPCVRIGTCFPEENYFPTVMSSEGPTNVVPATLTHVDWSRRMGGHPWTYRSSEVGPELIRRLRSLTPRYGDFGRSNGSDWYNGGGGRKDPFLFARKFAPNCLGPLLNISRNVIFIN